MTGRRKYYIFVCALLLAAAGCGHSMNERVSLWRKDKIPYGTYYAFNYIDYLFPGAAKQISVESPINYYALHDKSRTYEITGDTSTDILSDGALIRPHLRRSAYIIVSPAMKPDEAELRALLTLVSEGHTVFIAAMEIGTNLLDSLKLSASARSGFLNDSYTLTVSLNDPKIEDAVSYTYPGKALDIYFSGMDSAVTTVLGRNEGGMANFVKLAYDGGGGMYIHLAPAAFTNFFLLHKKNKSYFDRAMSYLPTDTKTIHWDDYYRSHTNGLSNDSKKTIF